MLNFKPNFRPKCSPLNFWGTPDPISGARLGESLARVKFEGPAPRTLRSKVTRDQSWKLCKKSPQIFRGGPTFLDLDYKAHPDIDHVAVSQRSNRPRELRDPVVK